MAITQLMEKAVLTLTPQQVAVFCRSHLNADNMGRALGLACRFRGVEVVKALAESGAWFKSGKKYVIYWASLLDVSPAFERASCISDICRAESVQTSDSGGAVTLYVLPPEKRAETVRYLCENSERVRFEPSELLFYSIISGSREITVALKEMGVSFSESRAAALTERGDGYFCNMTACLGDREFIDAVQNVVKELGGKKLRFTDKMFTGNYDPKNGQVRFFHPEIFGFILEHFDQVHMNKTQIMKRAADQNSVDCLAICARHGWLGQPKRRDEIIAYARDIGSTECTVWLLDYKKRNFDLEAEREKAEKKAARELNAAPDSVTALKNIWSWKKKEDGTLIITDYKGHRTDITVPPTIGRSAVTVIGKYAFSSHAPKITDEQKEFRETIRSVTLPKSICRISEGAFLGCSELSKIKIPVGIKAISSAAFGNCNFTEFTVPDTIEAMGKHLFMGCHLLRSVDLPDYCTAICDGMFAGTGLRSIKLPKELLYIGTMAFYQCNEMEEPDIPEGVVEIGAYAFSGCAKFKQIVIPDSVEQIGEGAFSGCSELRTVKLPRTLAVISEKMFDGCAALREISIPSIVRRIDARAFNECGSLEKVFIPRGVVGIGKQAFMNCGALRTAVISKGVNTLGYQAFADCGRLETVVIPASVTKIGDMVFKGSDNVTAFVMPNSFAEEYCKRNNIPFRHGDAR